VLLLAGSGAWASDMRGDARSEVPSAPLEQVVTVVEALANEAARDSASSASVMSTSPRQTPLDAVQDAVKNALNSALETVQSNSLVEAGMASWYGSAFQGRRTASGERFDMNQLTAAHKTLPLGTVVQVRNLAESLQVAFDAGAKKILLPMSSVGDIPSVPGELFAKFQTSFYSDPVDAVFKAIGVE